MSFKQPLIFEGVAYEAILTSARANAKFQLTGWGPTWDEARGSWNGATKSRCFASNLLLIEDRGPRVRAANLACPGGYLQAKIPVVQWDCHPDGEGVWGNPATTLGLSVAPLTPAVAPCYPESVPIRQSNRRVAKKTGLSPTYIGRVLRGLRDPHFSVAIQIAAAMGISLSELARRIKINREAGNVRLDTAIGPVEVVPKVKSGKVVHVIRGTGVEAGFNV